MPSPGPPPVSSQSHFGAVTSISDIPWAPDPPASSFRSAGGAAATAARSSFAAAPSIAAAAAAGGGGRPWSSLGGGYGGYGAAVSGWRLLTGHSSGQLVLWEAGGGKLRPMCVLGEPGVGSVSAVR